MEKSREFQRIYEDAQKTLQIVNKLYDTSRSPSDFIESEQIMELKHGRMSLESLLLSSPKEVPLESVKSSTAPNLRRKGPTVSSISRIPTYRKPQTQG
jgi:hypothetical protein